ncbi:hypothetical protein LRX75_22530 [Rhizobium sp. DKSPLA3]|uniref:Uncharacterized protein n=1 Tax=Rhizobium quercicola TaxID=2901226 RepID=A0A9X1T2Q1_9HYPH|nr:hypothetical protein [Rhizobium quercicola]MCD7111807.1 hypothetical protein [Rhizobium quercicola]
MKEHRYDTHHIDWRGIRIRITYECNWLAIGGYNPCHLTLTSEVPARCPLPLAETGFLSHFTDPELVNEAGGSVAFVTAALDAAAQSGSWQLQEEESRQLALF